MTRQKIETPYYPIQHLLREFANGLGTKGLSASTAKKIDDACKVNEINPHLYESLKSELIHEPLTKYVNVYFADHMVEQFDQLITQYLELLHVAPMDGVAAEKGRNFIDKYFLTFTVALACGEMLEGMRLFAYEVAKSGMSLTAIALDKLMNDSEWQIFAENCSDEQKERIRAWISPEKQELADITSIAALGEKWERGNGWGTIKARLITARLWDYFYSRYQGTDLTLIYSVAPQNIDRMYSQNLTILLNEAKDKYQVTSPLALELFGKLRLRVTKTDTDKKRCLELLPKLEQQQRLLDYHHETTYYYYWMKARFALHLGELNESVVQYKQAFEQVIYRQGENTVLIIREALIASCRMTKPDKTFINRLRRMAALLNVDIMPSAASNDTSKKKPEDIEQWEVAAYAQDFDHYFTKNSFFPGASYPENPYTNTGMWWVDETAIDLDLVKPNKVLAVGEEGGLIKKMSQLVYFSMKNDTDAVSELLKQGADVNKLSSSNESALLLAIQELQVNLFPVNSMKDDNFWAISRLPHDSAVLDAVTIKRKLSPLGCAVQTCRLDIVERVIDLGASIDRRHDTGNETPLFTVISLISRHTRMAENERHFEKMKYSNMNLQSIRANSAGLLPHDLQNLKAVLMDMSSDESKRFWQSFVLKHEKENFYKFSTAQGFRDIAKYLIEQGANPNAKHTTAVEDYTPLMLAVELDEVELVDAMIKSAHYPGDLTATCLVREANLRAGIFDIACKWNSLKVLKYLYPMMEKGMSF
jgi:hypothetical protein